MKAVILVGGEGTRLRPLTCNIPKAIVPILNRPFLEHLIDYLKKHGITEVILTICYLPDPIKDCIGDGSRLGVRVYYVMENSPLGTAGAVKNVEQFLDEPFLVFNGDIITHIDLTSMIKRHFETKPKVSIALTPVDNPTIYGVVETDSHDMVKRFVEKPGPDEVTTNMINAGIYILEPEVLARIPYAKRSMFEHDIFPSLLNDGEPIRGYPTDAYWIDIGTPKKYLKVQHDLLNEKGNGYVKTEGTSQIHRAANIKGPVLIAEGCDIAEDARIKGPAVLGARCQIANGAHIEGCVLWEGVKIGEMAELKNCVVGTASDIGKKCHIPEGCVLGDNTRLVPGLKMANDTIVEPDTIIAE